MKSVFSNAYASMLPPAPAGTITLFASMRPRNELIDDTFGCVWPEGHNAKKGSVVFGTTVMVVEYAVTPGGSAQSGEAASLIRRVSALLIDGGPNSLAIGRYAARVSTARHGVIG